MKRQILAVSVLLAFFFLVSDSLATDRLVPGEYSTIQAAINDCNNGDTVIISPGTYTGAGNCNIDFGGKAITVTSTNPQDPCVVATTVIDCQNVSGQRGFYFHSGESTSSVIDGLTITDGYVKDCGGAIYCYGGSPLIRNCLIKNCKAGAKALWNTNAYGGAIFSIAGTTVIEKCTIINNTAQGGDAVDIMHPVAGNGYGGAIYAVSTTTIRDCNLSNNSAIAGMSSVDGAGVAYGGAIYGVFNLSNSIVSGNKSDVRGPYTAYAGALYTQGTSSVVNCLIKNNACISIWVKGGAIWNTGTLSISNCTIYGNYFSPDFFVTISGSGTGTIINSIIWGNSPGPDVANMTVSYSCTEDNISGVGNIYSNPLFTTGPLGDFYLSQLAAGQAVDSPCVNAGSDTAVNLGMDKPTTRTDQLWDNGIVDMGYHYPIVYRSADIDKNLIVDFFDFAILANNWHLSEPNLSADITRDLKIDFKDLLELADAWLDCLVKPASGPNPANSAGNVDPNVILGWAAGYGALEHDVYLGTDAAAVSEANHLSPEYMDTVSEVNFTPDILDFNTTYYWRVDEIGPRCTATGAVWSFTTVPPQPPGAASNPNPADSIADVSVTQDLSWTAGAGATSHDVYFGTDNPPPFIQNQADTTYDTGTMNNGTTYYWRIDEKSAGGTTTGTVWNFTTIPLVTLLQDGFETDFNNWTDGGITNWDMVTNQKHAGSYSARASSNTDDLISDNMNTSGRSSIRIEFWYRDSGIDDDDDVYLQLYNGSIYDNKFELGNTTPEDAWYKYDVTIYNSGSDAQYFRTDFRIKFEGTNIDGGENLWIDDVNITAQ